MGTVPADIQAANTKAGRSHLLRHTLPEIDIAEHFGTTDGKEIAKDIARMGQKELQAKFKSVYGAPTFSNNNNWLRRKLMEAAGLQTPKVLGTGQSSPRKQGLMGGDGGLDGGAFERLQGGIRRTKRQRKPKQYEDMMLGEGAAGEYQQGRGSQRGHEHRGTLSLGEAYLQHHSAVYQASLGWQESPEYLLGHSLLAKHGLPPGLSLPQLAEVVWPGAQGRGMRQDESNSSSEDQTAYEGHQHSHASHSTVSHDGGPPSRGRASAAAALGSHLTDMHSPARAQKLVREIQEAVALLGGAGAAAARAGARPLFPRGTLAELGFPAFEPRDLAAERVWAGNAAARLPGFGPGTSAAEVVHHAAVAAAAAGGPGGPSPMLSLQEFLQRSGAVSERVGGNTPMLDDDFDCALVDAPGLLEDGGEDAFEMATARLPSMEPPSGSGNPIGAAAAASTGMTAANGEGGFRGPSLGADLAALFPTLNSTEGIRLLSQLGNGTEANESAISSLDRLLHELQPDGAHDARYGPPTGSSVRAHAPALPRTPTASPRAGAGSLEGAAAPSMRFAGIPSFSAASAGGTPPASSPRFADARARGALPPVSPRAAPAAGAQLSPRATCLGPATPYSAATAAAAAAAGSQQVAALAASMSLHSPRGQPSSPIAAQHASAAQPMDSAAPVTPAAVTQPQQHQQQQLNEAMQRAAVAQKPAPGSALDDLVAALSARRAPANPAAAAKKPAAPAAAQEEQQQQKGTPDPETVDPLSFLH